MRIKLTQGKYALIDDKDFEQINKYKWHTSRGKATCYARTWVGINGKQKMFSMHRLIMDCPKGMEVDHIDHNGLNNQRSNLRICTTQENKRNCSKKLNATSKYKGVSQTAMDKSRGVWCSQIRINKILHRLGYFKSEIEAAKAYDSYAKSNYGEFKTLNFE